MEIKQRIQKLEVFKQECLCKLWLDMVTYIETIIKELK